MMQELTSRVPTLFLLHFLGGSGQTWRAVVSQLRRKYRCVSVDLAGFGSASNDPGKDIAGMATDVIDMIRAQAPQTWWIVGHSMGAKVALVVARRAEDGWACLQGLSGLVLMAGSPPSPEPMSDHKRLEMVDWIDAGAAKREQKAREYIAQNVGRAIDPTLQARAIEDVLRANPEAWKAWLEGGSREDWCRAVGVLCSPALILSGSADLSLGPSMQMALTTPHLAHHRHIVLEGVGHLVPIEQPSAVAKAIFEFVAAPTHVVAPAVEIADEYRLLIHSDRVNKRLRAALEERAAPDDLDYQPIVLDPIELSILRVACDRIIPQPSPKIDLAARIDRRLAAGFGDGWRHEELPPDGLTYRRAARTLDAAARAIFDRPFVALQTQQLDALLRAVAMQDVTSSAPLTTAQMQLWFEDLRADAVGIYLSHPASLSRLGFSGIGAGGDDVANLLGFSTIGIDEREPWEPPAASCHEA